MRITDRKAPAWVNANPSQHLAGKRTNRMTAGTVLGSNPAFEAVWNRLESLTPASLAEINPLLQHLFALEMRTIDCLVSRETIIDRRKRIIAIIVNDLLNGIEPKTYRVGDVDIDAYNNGFINPRIRAFSTFKFPFKLHIEAAQVIIGLMQLELD